MKLKKITEKIAPLAANSCIVRHPKLPQGSFSTSTKTSTPPVPAKHATPYRKTDASFGLLIIITLAPGTTFCAGVLQEPAGSVHRAGR